MALQCRAWHIWVHKHTCPNHLITPADMQAALLTNTQAKEHRMDTCYCCISSNIGMRLCTAALLLLQWEGSSWQCITQDTVLRLLAPGGSLSLMSTYVLNRLLEYAATESVAALQAGRGASVLLRTLVLCPCWRAISPDAGHPEACPSSWRDVLRSLS
jgi:hypothetical protein